MSPNDLATLFAVRLRQLREERKLLPGQLAERAGCDRTWIVHLEAARKLPTLGMIFSLAAALEVDAFDLLVFPAHDARHQLVDLTRKASEAGLRSAMTALSPSPPDRGTRRRGG